jgi:hypothetical protein
MSDELPPLPFPYDAHESHVNEHLPGVGGRGPAAI